MINRGIKGDNTNMIAKRLIDVFCRSRRIISTEAMIYSGRVKRNSQALERAPRTKASERVLIELAFNSRALVYLLGINSFVPLPRRK